MGGRGASSGISKKGKIYGSEYHTILKSGNIKFVKYNEGNTTAPMETMTKGRIYVTLDYKEEPKFITYYDKTNKRYKQIDLDHSHKDIKGIHKHLGYEHNEKGTKLLNTKEEKMVDRILKTWYNKK